MKISKQKLDISMARSGKDMTALKRETSCGTVNRIYQGLPVRPKTVNKIARALGCDVLDIIEGEKGD